jgi:xanthine dehydrogenase accessory factor
MDIFQEMADRQARGEPFILATLVRTAGSSPRDAGARMLIMPDGSISGTIGGGMFEKMVIDDCLALLNGEIRHLLKTYRFTESGPDSTGMYCGGEAQVFMEVHAQRDKLIIFGGGHIGRELARIATGLNFKITVVDDRPDILREYHPPVVTILTNSDYTADFPAIDRNCYIVIVTRGHACDRSVLARVVNADCAYIGMIGSRSKIAKTFASLEDDGIEKSRLALVHAPIGLDIGAEGPSEIAIAIAAELIAVRKSLLRVPGS